MEFTYKQSKSEIVKPKAVALNKNVKIGANGNPFNIERRNNKKVFKSFDDLNSYMQFAGLYRRRVK